MATGQSPTRLMTAAQVQRARERDCEKRGLTLSPQREIRPSRPNPPYKRKRPLA